MITLDESFSLSVPDSVKVEFIRFAYDVEKAAKAVEDSLKLDRVCFCNIDWSWKVSQDNVETD